MEPAHPDDTGAALSHPNATINITPRTAAALQARRATTDDMVERVTQVLRQMRRERAAVTVAAVARRAGVSRTFLYQNEQARRLVEATGVAAATDVAADRVAEAAAIETSWRERALNAEHELRRTHSEITTQRGRIGELLGQIRDLESDLPPDGVQQLLTENHTLKAQVRQLAQDNRRLEERLAGARDNNRLLDKRVADLKVELLDRPTQ